MKLADVILLSLSLAFAIVGIHLSLTVGIETSYPFFMLSVALLFWFQYRKMNKPEEESKPIRKTKSRKKR